MSDNPPDPVLPGPDLAGEDGVNAAKATVLRQHGDSDLSGSGWSAALDELDDDYPYDFAELSGM
jgi:hypothetical protein